MKFLQNDICLEKFGHKDLEVTGEIKKEKTKLKKENQEVKKNQIEVSKL